MPSDRRTSHTTPDASAGRSRTRGGRLRRAAVACRYFDPAATSGGAPRRRHAFTIFELLIVLAILVTTLAISWPVLDRIHTEYRLRQGGHLVQARLAGARVHAIDTGFDYQFRYEPGGQRFLVIPYDQQALQTTGASGANGPTGAGAGTRPPKKIAGRLPSTQTQFDPGSSGGSVPQSVPAEWLSGIHDADQFTGVSWSVPLLFHADGTATTGQVAIRDKQSRVVTVSIRALTGSVSVSKIENGATP